MAFIEKGKAKELLADLVSRAENQTCLVRLNGREKRFSRFAGNKMTASGNESDLELSYTVSNGQNMGTASTSDLSKKGLDELVRKALSRAGQAANISVFPIIAPRRVEDAYAFFPIIRDLDEKWHANVCQQCTTHVAAKGLVAWGELESEMAFSALANSKGFEAYHSSSKIRFQTTVRTKDGKGQGSSRFESSDGKQLVAEQVYGEAIERASNSRDTKTIDSGIYTVILHPEATLKLLRPILESLNSSLVESGRSYFSEQGSAKNTIPVIDSRISISSNPFHEQVPTKPWDEWGGELKKINWIERGIVKTLTNNREQVRSLSQPVTPFNGQIIIEGGRADLRNMIKFTQSGLLINDFDQLLCLDPLNLQYTGVTSNGVRVIEQGRLLHPCRDLRFTVNLIDVFNHLGALGTSQRVEDCWVPLLKLNNFTFSGEA